MNINNKGQSLFELVVTIGVLSLFLIVLIGAVSRSIAVSTFSRQKSEANNYAQEALEWIRRERDLDFQAFYSQASGSGSVYCVNNLTFVGGNCSGTIPGTLFAREVTLTTNGVDKVDVSVLVYWTSSSGRHETKSSLTLTNWKER